MIYMEELTALQMGLDQTWRSSEEWGMEEIMTIIL